MTNRAEILAGGHGGPDLAGHAGPTELRALWASAGTALRGLPEDRDAAMAIQWGRASGGGPRVVVGSIERSMQVAALPSGIRSVFPHGYPGPGVCADEGRLVPDPPDGRDAVWIGVVAYGAAFAVEPGLSGCQSHGPLASWGLVEQPAIIESAVASGTERAAADRPEPEPGTSAAFGSSGGYRLSRPESVGGEARFVAAVERALEYIRAGDVYQVNLTHPLCAELSKAELPEHCEAKSEAKSEARSEARNGAGIGAGIGAGQNDPGSSPWSVVRAFAADLLASAAPEHGVYLEGRDADGQRWAVCSASPERFLSYNAATGRLLTSPMKGTVPIDVGRAVLEASEKDRAELVMIVDLMRNDIGRVCTPGSVRVDSARRIEAHGGTVWQAVADVSGTLRAGLGFGDAVAAMLAPGSVTGAPKIRAMEIIRELEGWQRGWYCGSAGWIDAKGADLNVAIRTATVTPGAGGVPASFGVTYPVGAGIVADSDPAAEWRETLVKSAVLDRLVTDAGGPDGQGSNGAGMHANSTPANGMHTNGQRPNRRAEA